MRLGPDGRLIAPMVNELLVEPSSRSSPTTPSLQTARAHRGSPAEYSETLSPVEDMRDRLRALRAPVREVIERRHLEEEALLDDDVTWRVTVRQNLKAQLTKSRTSHRHHGTRLAYWDMASNHLTSDSLRWNATRGPHCNDFAVREARADDGEPMTIWGHGWRSSTRALDACERQRQRQRSHGLLCKLSGRLREKNLFVGRFRHGGAQLSEQRPRRTGNSDTWRTTENSSISHAESLQKASYAELGNLAMDG